MAAVAGGMCTNDVANGPGGQAWSQAVSADDLNLIVEDTYWTVDLQDKAAHLQNPQQFTLTFPDGRTLMLAMIDNLQLTVNLGSDALRIGVGGDAGRAA